MNTQIDEQDDWCDMVLVSNSEGEYELIRILPEYDNVDLVKSWLKIEPDFLFNDEYTYYQNSLYWLETDLFKALISGSIEESLQTVRDILEADCNTILVQAAFLKN